MVDGTSRLNALGRIALPLALPGIVLFAFIDGRVVSGLTAGSIK